MKEREKKKGGNPLSSELHPPRLGRCASCTTTRLTPYTTTNCKSSNEPPGARSHDKCDGYFLLVNL